MTYGTIGQVPSSAAGKEWRGHVEQTKKYEEAIQVALPATSTQLALVSNEVTRRGASHHNEGGHGYRH